MDIREIQHRYFGTIAVREGTSDVAVLNEVLRSYKYLSMKDGVVFDIGGHIGGFSMYAALSGAREVFAFEPNEDSFRLLEQNTARYPCIRIIRAAVIARNNKAIIFYKSLSGKNPGNCSIVPFEGRVQVAVPAVNFASILQEYHPSIIKMDCEGAEFELLYKPLPDFVKQIVVEIHFSKRIFRILAPALIYQFKDWEEIKKPVYNDRSWFCLGCWKR